MWKQMSLLKAFLAILIVNFLVTHVLCSPNINYLDGTSAVTFPVGSFQKQVPAEYSVAFAENLPNIPQSSATSTSTSSISSPVFTNLDTSSNNINPFNYVSLNANSGSAISSSTSANAVSHTTSASSSLGSASSLGSGSSSLGSASSSLGSASSSLGIASSSLRSVSSSLGSGSSSLGSESSSFGSTSSSSGNTSSKSVTAVSVPGSGNPSSGNLDAVSSITSTASPNVSTASPLNEEATNEPFAKAALALPILQKFLEVKIPGFKAANMFFTIAENILSDLGYPKPSVLAREIAQSSAGIDILTLPLYLQAMDKTLRQFLFDEGIKLDPSFSQNYANIIENIFLTTPVNNALLLYKNFFEGLKIFMSSLGFDVAEKAGEVASLLSTAFLELGKI